MDTVFQVLACVLPFPISDAVQAVTESVVFLFELLFRLCA